MSEKIILGIDPGTTVMGYGLIKVVNNQMKFLLLNELDLKKYKDHYLKLKLIFNRTLELIENYHPDELALEVFLAKCSIHVKTWKSPRSCYGCWSNKRNTNF